MVALRHIVPCRSDPALPQASCGYEAMGLLGCRGHRLLHQPVSPQLDPRYACLDGWTASSCVGTSRRICKTLCRLKHTVSSDEAESGTASSSLVSSGETSILGFGSSRLTQLVEWQRTFEAERDPLCPSSRKRIEKKRGWAYTLALVLAGCPENPFRRRSHNRSVWFVGPAGHEFRPCMVFGRGEGEDRPSSAKHGNWSRLRKYDPASPWRGCRQSPAATIIERPLQVLCL